MAYSFKWVSSYMGCVDYTVYGDGESYRVQVRRETSDYERGRFNHNSMNEWDRDVVASIDLLRRVNRSDQPIKAEIVDAFNAWLQAKHSAFVAKLRAEPERYGEIAEDDPVLIAPRVVHGGFYAVGCGWRTAA